MSLSASDVRLLRLTAAIVLGRWDVLAELRRRAPRGEPDRRWREALLQAHLFAGFPRVVEAASVLEGCGGVGAVGEDEIGSVDASAGRALFDAIYGEQAQEVRAELRGFHPELARWIEEHAYARVLARPGLAADRRELCAVAALAVQGQERQLASHARGALRVGATTEEVLAALEAVADLGEGKVVARAREVVGRFAREG